MRTPEILSVLYSGALAAKDRFSRDFNSGKNSKQREPTTNEKKYAKKRKKRRNQQKSSRRRNRKK